MDFFRRIGVCSVVLFAVGCSKGDPETVEPVAKPETVIIGCSGVAGADVDVRTQLGEFADDGVSVHWEKSDAIRLWACERGTKNYSACLANAPFRFDYYSPSKSQAGFAGDVDLSKFNAGTGYDYYAVSPVPAEDPVGTQTTYTIPAEQTGDYDGRYDILTACLEDAPALKAGDDNPSVKLTFKHHIHLLRFTIPSNKLGEPVRAVELTFPSAVVGQLTVDATDPAMNQLSAVDSDNGQKVKIEFSKGQERDAGDTFYAMIAPVTFESSGTIGMRIIGTMGETSVNVPIADNNEIGDKMVNQTLTAGHLTHIQLNVPTKNTFYTVLRFKVADNTRDDLKSEPNRLGKNTLGERLDIVRLKGGSGAFSNAVRMTAGCSVLDGGATLACEVPDDPDFKGEYELSFVSRKDAGSKCPYDVWDSSVISGQKLEVEYQSESALIRSISGYSTVQTETVPTIDPTRTEPYEFGTLSIPYLFEEDFSKADGLDVNGTNNDKVQEGTNLDNGKFCYGGWTGNQIAGSAGYFEIKTRVESTRLITGLYNGRLDSAPMKYWRDGSKKRLQVQFDYYHHAGSSAGYTRAMCYGTTTDPNSIDAYWYGMDGWKPGSGGNKVSGNSQPLSVDQGGSINEWYIASPTSATRLSWELEVTGTPETGGYNHFLRLSNLKVSIVE